MTMTSQTYIYLTDRQTNPLKINISLLNFSFFSVFGKTMENSRDYRHIDLVATEAKAERLTKQPSYRAHHVFHDNLIAVERYQTSVKMDKPIYIGMYSILSCSNLLKLAFVSASD